MRVGRRQIHGVFVHRSAAMADVKSLIDRMRVVPHLPRRPRIECPEIVGRCDVQKSVDEDWRRFDWLAPARGAARWLATSQIRVRLELPAEWPNPGDSAATCTLQPERRDVFEWTDPAA